MLAPMPVRRGPQRRNPFRRDKGRNRSVRAKPNEYRWMLAQLEKLPDDFALPVEGRLVPKAELTSVLEGLYAADEAVARSRWQLREARLAAMRAVPRARALLAELEELAKTNPAIAAALNFGDEGGPAAEPQDGAQDRQS